MEKISNNLKKYRKLRYLTQYELSLKTKLSQGTIWQLEQGFRQPNDYQLKILSEVLEISEGELFPEMELAEI